MWTAVHLYRPLKRLLAALPGKRKPASHETFDPHYPKNQETMTWDSHKATRNTRRDAY
jgi:hypothetical protein